ncbi:hypothetical protein TREMEDRAFT_30126 [Tremella mesenterica DSM 1558]|uniref:uncharacterized protein n=1 Tax=Tremella mesenterica (strain ATCC 24925 / CBS 8224 / DSM 1558 / NBRC 9311 / NRRL Y-6157 / RJB 2259-6 / UBC 559-6) TaxID=578456 RepID=UPI0003F4923B|nr:uncharacterized protein TREMEDRAFT_30126 [Tremella mesenterica DSM 1558]EIW69972.1 hypothetical protein TREMEDRAFT_30126 [Tremella mesenterica DSM 1558]
MRLDKAGEDQFCRFVDRMPEKPDGMIRLFDRGDYFSAHGSDALIVAHQVFKTTNVIKYLGSSSLSSSIPSTSKNTSMTPRGLPSVDISTNLTKAFLRECLTTRQMRVEIYIPEDGTGGRKNHYKWILGKVASPGNIEQVEDLIFDNEDLDSNAVSMALKLHMVQGIRTVGCAFLDVQEKTLGVSEYVDDANFGNTESLLIQLQVKECILPSDEKRADVELTKLRTMIDRCGLVITERRSADYKAGNIEQDVSRLLDGGHTSTTLPEFDLKLAMSSLAALLVYTNLVTSPQYEHQFRLYRHDLTQYMKLDASAVKALSLMPNPQELGGGRNMSLYGLLNQCKTSQGQRLLGRWLKQPLVNLHEIRQRQGIVEAFVDDALARQTLQEQFLSRMPDFHRISKKLHRNVASLDEVVRVFYAIQLIGPMIEVLETLNTSEENKQLIATIYVIALRDHEDKLTTYSQMVEDTVDLNDKTSHNHVLQASFDPKLEEYKTQLMAVRSALDEEHAKVGEELGLDIGKKLHLERHQVYNYSFRITKAEAGLIRNKKQYRDLATQKSGTIFTTATLKGLSEDYDRLMDKYNDKQRTLVKEVVSIAASYTPVLEALDNLIAAIDVTVSLARVSANANTPYVRPVLFEKGKPTHVIVRGARHPCLEVQDDVSFIANDHEMKKGKCEFVVLTGPNMGGKSTYIRQIGVIALMAQIGCFVPADEAQLPVFDCILARVGAGDSQLKGVSTFMAEMLETATILRSATKDSLIIIDELGRGTSTYDGFGLAWAISEHIATKIRCFCLFATHYHELTALNQTQPHVKNLHVEAHVQPIKGGKSKQDRDITLLYKVTEGICDQSFGIHVAELAQFPESIIKLAKRKAEELEDFGDGANDESLNKYSETETDQGAALMQEFLQTWKSRAEVSLEELSEEGQVGLLRKTATEFKERFEGSPWIMGVLKEV